MPTNLLILPDMPKIEGLSFRHTIGIDDLEALLAIHAGRAVRDGVDPYSSEEDYPSRERLGAALEGLNPEQRERRLVAAVNDKVMGYSTLSCWQENDERWVYLVLGWLLPEWRGKGIGTAMLHWGEQKARQWAAAERPGASYEFAANASSTEQDTTALLLHEGYTVGYSVLELGLSESTPVEESPLPAGVELRPVFRIHYLLISQCIAEAYKDEYADKRYQEIFDPVDYAQRLCDSRHDPKLWQVAWDGETVAGQVIPVIEKGRAVIQEVSIRPAYRRKGLARALLTRVLREMHSRGVKVICINTVGEYKTRACDLYRSVGFELVKVFPRYRKSAG
jgi:mycothiol synthase